jgi:hypothetical protein
MEAAARGMNPLKRTAAVVILLCIVGMGKATAAADAMGVADMGPQPCALPFRITPPEPREAAEPPAPRPMLLPLAPPYARGWMLASTAPSFTALLGELPVPNLSFAEVGMIAVGIFFAVAFYLKVGKLEDNVAKKAAAIVTGALGAKHETHIADQPIMVEGVRRCVEHRELEERLTGYVTAEDLHEVEQRLAGKQEENFRALDGKRSSSIGLLHQHLTDTTQSLTQKIGEGDGKTHDRIEAVGNTLRAEFESKLSEVRGDIGDLPSRVITLLQQTGQIGQGTKR